jgi:hypothetical protein
LSISHCSSLFEMVYQVIITILRALRNFVFTKREYYPRDRGVVWVSLDLVEENVVISE